MNTRWGYQDPVTIVDSEWSYLEDEFVYELTLFVFLFFCNMRGNFTPMRGGFVNG